MTPNDTFTWTLVIEFNGLCAAEVVKCKKGKGKEVLIHFVSDPMHHPILAARDVDIRSVHDCGPAYKLLTRDSTHDKGIDTPASTIAVWPAVRGSVMSILDAADCAIDVDTSNPVMAGEEPKNPKSLRWLPILGHILGKSDCDRREDFAQFRLQEGVVTPGRLSKRIWKVFVDGSRKPKRHGPLAVSIVYELTRDNTDPVIINLHPGMLALVPPKHILDKKVSGYKVEVTISSLPVGHTEAPSAHGEPDEDHVPHFDEYNRLVGTNKRVRIVEDPGQGATVEDPIHCFSSGVVS